ncbi:MAG: rhodanese-like domain-containing protein [Deltaproteobacteria bacterium]|nr:rhodanese-like domain-containing protein [Deltaproteobacteria bacterium]MBW2075683.1 rhodanese-like domain-containing protein [Deltaproteobacteria bacterium]RLB80102.1 MAG: rhodanese-like domain-containing protein [Deltaproteobacteria bacterium]
MALKFPYRSQYPNVPPISTEELASKYDAGKVVIIDVRSKIEYNVIHPMGAIHLPVSKMTFVRDLGELIAQHPGKTFAFYCNGVTCLKSYEATKKAIKAGYQNCYVYDAGIPDWAIHYPEKTLLLGKPISNPEKQLIPKSEFKKKCLSFEDFKAKATGPNTMVIDVRDHIQSSGKLPGLEDARSIPLDVFIPNFVERKAHQDKTLLIFDQVGKQVRWLEYYLVENGYNNYFFLKGGATAVIKKQIYK